MTRTESILETINPDKIKPNPENPRLVFREEDMNELLQSIQQVGIKVPLTIYKGEGHFTLIDGERRWRCARKLNLETVPVIIQPKPNPLENLLMMFNIHNVRVDWDLMPMALKLAKVRDMLAKDGKPHDAGALAAVTGVRLATIKRAIDLLNMPLKYQNMLLEEAAKPRSEQHVKADLFIEIYKSLHSVERHIPEVFERVTKAQYVDSLVGKYLEGTIDNVVSFRNISKIARAENAGASKRDAIPAIVNLVKKDKYSVQNAYAETVENSYTQKDLVVRMRSLTSKLTNFKDSPDRETKEELITLRKVIDSILGR